MKRTEEIQEELLYIENTTVLKVRRESEKEWVTSSSQLAKVLGVPFSTVMEAVKKLSKDGIKYTRVEITLRSLPQLLNHIDADEEKKNKLLLTLQNFKEVQDA